jgi:hypothetical protein
MPMSHRFVLAGFGQVDIDSAFNLLRAYVRSANAKLGVVAEQLVRRQLSPTRLIESRGR